MPKDPITLTQGKQVTMPSQEQIDAMQTTIEHLEQKLKDVSEHNIRLQKQVNELKKEMDDISVPQVGQNDISVQSAFEERVWEAVLHSVISNMMNPSLIHTNEEKSRKRTIHKALETAEEWVNVSRIYLENRRVERENKEKEKASDPLATLIASNGKE